MNGISALIRRDRRELSSTLCFLPHEDTMRRYLSANQEKCLHKTLDLPAP